MTSLPAPPNRLAFGSAPLASSSLMVSLPSRLKTWMVVVLATVATPPSTVTAPPLTRIVPAALRLMVMVLFRASPLTVSTPPLKDAVTAAWADAVVAPRTPAASTPPASILRIEVIVLLLRQSAVQWPAAGSESLTHFGAKLFRFGPLAEEAEQKLVDALRLVDLHPVRGALDVLVAPRACDELTGRGDPILGQIVVAAAPDAERVGLDRGERRTRLELALRVQVRAVPVQPRGQRAGLRQLLDVAVGVTVVAQPLPEQAPVVAPEQLLGEAFELEQQLVPRRLALSHRTPRERARMADGHHDQAIHAMGMNGGEQPCHQGAEVVPDDVRPLDLELIQYRD